MCRTAPTPQSAHPEVPQGRIVFEQVSFRYPNQSAQSEPVLKRYQPDHRTGPDRSPFLGGHRSGQIDPGQPDSPLLRRHPGGRITIDGIDRAGDGSGTAPWPLCGIALQESVAVLAAKCGITSATATPIPLKTNMIAAAKAADAHSFVSAIPEGYGRCGVARRGALTSRGGGSGSGWRSPAP